MEFETERLILRPWKDSDAWSLYEYAKDSRVGPVAGWPPHASVEDSRDIIRNVLSAEETYAVCLRQSNQAVGSIGLLPPSTSHTSLGPNEFEVGYWIGVPFWGQGLIPEALERIVTHTFVDLGASALWCGYYEGNAKSQRCSEKCGFVYHHTEKHKPCQLMGDKRTEHYARITREEWDRSMGAEQNKEVDPYGK